MKKKKSLTFFEVIGNLLVAYFEQIVDLARLASLEGELARRTLPQLLVLFFVLGILAISTTLSVFVLLFIGLIALHVSLFVAAVIIVILNFFLLLGVWLLITKLRKNMSFPATRKQLSVTHAKMIKNKALSYE